MAGDFVVGLQDSRYWGLLPEDFVVGKVALIWKSEDPETGRFRWKRFMKKVKQEDIHIHSTNNNSPTR